MRSALAGAILALSLGVAAAGNVAFVADIRGNATIEGDGKLNFLAELPAGSRLLLGSGATAVVTYASSGAEFTAVGPGEFLVTAAEMKAEKGATPSRRTVSVLPDPGVVTRVSRAGSASHRMRGVEPGAAREALEYPVDSRIATLQPALRWRGEALGGPATVSLRDANGRELWKDQVNPGSAKPPVKLAPATQYTWTVMTPNRRIGEARFETLPAEMVAKAQKSRAGARSFSDPVMHAFLLQQIGAVQDAREAWAALARERPDLPELASLAR
jgi:hypothetical protein